MTNKLLNPWNGKPLISQAIASIAGIAFRDRVAVVPATRVSGAAELTALLALNDFLIARNDEPEQGLESSLRLGIAFAAGRRCDAVLVALGDMPLVPRSHYEALLGAASTTRAAISAADTWTSPPWVAPRAWIEETSDRPTGIRSAMRGPAVVRVEADPRILRDFDTLEDFA